MSLDLENVEEMVEELENQELMALGGVPPAQVYAKLLALYLYQFDMCNAKFLWKRIPKSIKTQNTEIAMIWSVGKAMWARDAVASYKALNYPNWSDNGIKSIMIALLDKIRDRCLNLIARAYTSLNVDTMSKYLGIANSGTLEIARSKEWQVQGNIIFPVVPNTTPPNITTTEEQLHILTDFVSFLEN